MSNHGILVRHLHKSFRKRTGFLKSKSSDVYALKDISFEVAEGETYGLLGPNGSGKSTLIRVLSTLLTPDSGEVRLLGHLLPGEERAVRQKIGRVSVDAAFYKKLSARENLLYSAYLYGLEPRRAERRAMEILEQLGLEEKRFTDPLEEMSRGMQQKVAIARALLTSPTVLLLDEPTTGLDPRSKLDVQTFIEEVRDSHDATIVLTTHDLDEAERLCDRIALINDGRMVAEGTPPKLMAMVAERYGKEPTLESVFMTFTGRSLDDDHDDAKSEDDD